MTDGNSLTDVINSNIYFAAAGDKTINTGLDHNLLINGVISGSNNLVKNGSGTLTLAGTNAYTGTTTVSNGILEITNKDALGSNAAGTTVESGGTVRLDLSDTTTSESFTINGTGAGGAGAIDAINANISGTITLGSDATISVSTRLDHSSTIEGDGFTLTKTGAGSLVRGGTFNASHLIIDQGQYQATSADAVVSGVGTSITVNSGGNFSFWKNFSVTNAPTLILNDGSTFSVTSNSADQVSSINGTMALTGNVLFDNWSHKHTVHSDISGTGSLTLRSIVNNQDYADYTFTGNNTYSGSTTVGNGSATAGKMTLKAGSTTAFSSNSAFSVTANSKLVLNGYNNSIGSLTGAGTVENASASAATLSVGHDNTSTTFSGTLQDGTGGGALSVVKEGSGAWTLDGSNTYTGTTTINAGSLLVGSDNSALTGTFMVNSGASLGGVGTLGSIGGHTTLAAGASLTLVDAQVASLLTFGGDLDLQAITAGALLFELGSAGASDTIAMDNLIISSLNLSDFTFTELNAIDLGSYTLLDATSITGTLGSETEGVLFGHHVELTHVNNDIILNVTAAVPEPSSSMLGLLGASALLLRRRRS